MRTRLNEIYIAILSNDYDCLVLSETWLTPNILSSECIDQRYNVIRCDRYDIRNEHMRGGGVLIALKKSFSFEHIKISTFSENVWIVISNSKRRTMIIGAIYIIPNASSETFNGLLSDCEIFLNNNSDIPFVLIGDFNCPGIDWCNLHDQVEMTAIDKSLLNFMNFVNAKQINRVTNFMDRILDLVFLSSDIEGCAELSVSPIGLVDIYHPPLLIHFNSRITVGKRRVMSVKKECLMRQSDVDVGKNWDFKKADFLGIYNDLAKINWECLFIHDNVNSNLNVFYSVVNDILTTHVPIKNNNSVFSGHRASYPVWITNETRQLIKNKNIDHRIYRKFPSDANYTIFSESRRKARAMTKLDQKNYMNHIEDEIKIDPKKFFTFFKCKDNEQSLPEIMYWNDICFYGEKEIVQGFSSYFASVYKTDHIDIPIDLYDKIGDSYLPFDIVDVTCSEIDEAIKGLNNTKAVGNDGVPTFLVKGCAGLFLEPLRSLFNQSLRTRCFPDYWKIGKIFPVYKNNGDRDNMTNYRPITITNVFSKVFESIIHKHLYFNVKSKISVYQHGGIPKRNISTNLLSFTSYVNEILEQGHQVDVFFSDFAKAFDSVDFVILIEKLLNFGCSCDLAKWFLSYLTDRKLFVNIHNCFSDVFTNNSGVPQGSILGALLFNIFINDACLILKYSFFQIFIDDLKFYRCIMSYEDCLMLQKDIDALFTWAALNKLPLNFSKCKIMMFTNKNLPIVYNYKILNTPVMLCNHVKDLGITFDESLSFKLHIQLIVNRAYRVMGYILRNAHNLLNVNSYFRLFNAFVRPILEFASIVWSPSQSNLINQIERVQTRFLRAVFYRFSNQLDTSGNDFYFYYFSSSNLRNLFSVRDFALRRDVQCLVFFKKLINGSFDCPFLLDKIHFNFGQRSLRYICLFRLPIVRSNRAMNFSIYKFCKIFNSLASEIDIFDSNVAHFQKLCYDKLICLAV